MHDGNKNVSEVVSYQSASGIAAHYEYAPFGEMTMRMRGNGWGSLDPSALNPWCFSSEYAEDVTATVYYNYRHYNSYDAKWLCRDSISESYVVNKYLFVHNKVDMIDVLGLAYGNPVSGPNGPIGSGWGPYYPDPWELPDNSPWYERIPDCPCSIELDEDGCPLSSGDEWTTPGRTGHKGGTWEIRSKPKESFGSGQQCVYDSAGKLINEGSGAGTPDMVSPESSLLFHVILDVAPYYWNVFWNGETEAERLDHELHPPNKGKDMCGHSCPTNDGSKNPPPREGCGCVSST